MTAPIPVPGGWTVPGNRHDLLDGRSRPEPPAVSVVLPFYRQQSQLDLVLAGLSAQTHPADRLQIVVADDGSERPPVVPTGTLVVRQADRGFRAGAARNLGAAAADGEVLCFLDADTVPEPGYVAAACRLPTLCPDALVVGRRRHADLTGWTPAQIHAWWGGSTAPREIPGPQWLAEAHATRLLDADERSYRHVLSAVLSLRADLFRELRGFDETLVGYGGEDWELAHRAWTAGAVFAYEPAAVAWHDGPDAGGRGLDPTTKNDETLALAPRIPDPHLRGGGWWPGVPAVAVEIASGSDPACLLAARSALRTGDVGVWLPRRLEALAADPRVHLGPVPPDLAAFWVVRLDRAAAIDVPALTATGAGRREAPGLVAEQTRFARRAARHGIPPGSLTTVQQVREPRWLDPHVLLERELGRLV